MRKRQERRKQSKNENCENCKNRKHENYENNEKPRKLREPRKQENRENRKTPRKLALLLAAFLVFFGFLVSMHVIVLATLLRKKNTILLHQWIRSAIRDSQQPSSPIGFLFLKLPPYWDKIGLYNPSPLGPLWNRMPLQGPEGGSDSLELILHIRPR